MYQRFGEHGKIGNLEKEDINEVQINELILNTKELKVELESWQPQTDLLKESKEIFLAYLLFIDGMSQIFIMKKNGENINVVVLGMKDEEGNAMESCPHPKQVVYLQLDKLPDVYDILRVANVKDPEED